MLVPYSPLAFFRWWIGTWRLRRARALFCNSEYTRFLCINVQRVVESLVLSAAARREIPYAAAAPLWCLPKKTQRAAALAFQLQNFIFKP